jgi:hypothetical protein
LKFIRDLGLGGIGNLVETGFLHGAEDFLSSEPLGEIREESWILAESVRSLFQRGEFLGGGLRSLSAASQSLASKAMLAVEADSLGEAVRLAGMVEADETK